VTVSAMRMLLLGAVLLAGRLLAADFAAAFERFKTNAPKAELYRFLYALPKGGDLHHHGAGCWQMDTLYQVATNRARNGNQRFYTRLRAGGCDGETNAWRKFATIGEPTWKALPACAQGEYAALDELTPAQRDAFVNSLRLDAPGEGRDEFFEEIWPRLGALGRSLDVNAEMTFETMRRYGAEGVRYLEAQTVPFMALKADGALATAEEFEQRLQTRLAQPDAQATGVTVRWQMVVLRFLPTAERAVEEAYRWVDAHRGSWVGINMAGREDNDKGHPRRFLDVYRRMRHRYSGIGLAIHAGEVDEANSHMRDTLLLGATRLGHGNNVLTDDDLVLHLRAGVAFVEINLVSNLLLEYVDDYSQHHFPELLRLGIPCGLSTDDSGMWDSSMTDEYFTAVTEFNLTWPELVTLGRNSLKWSFAEPALKERLLTDYDRAVQAFEQRLGDGDWPAQLGAVKPVTYGFAKRRWGLAY
jgi:adenosine deaminase CECR1